MDEAAREPESPCTLTVGDDKERLAQIAELARDALRSQGRMDSSTLRAARGDMG